tara:strand:+ start:767 stop:961 length:195 start_codon:yes stop_codon:yes gene_type:complete
VLTIWIRDNLDFTNVILEFYKENKGLESGWVHVSYDLTGNNEKKDLTARRDDNSLVKYTPVFPE